MVPDKRFAATGAVVLVWTWTGFVPAVEFARCVFGRVLTWCDDTTFAAWCVLSARRGPNQKIKDASLARLPCGIAKACVIFRVSAAGKQGAHAFAIPQGRLYRRRGERVRSDSSCSKQTARKRAVLQSIRQRPTGLGLHLLDVDYAAACSSSCPWLPTRNSAALRAAAAAVKIARLSFFNTFNQLAI